MKQSLSLLIIFLLITAVWIPAVNAEAPAEYHQLHNLCICGAHEDLGHIPYLCLGIGYKAWIDTQTDKWFVFIHAGLASKELVITPCTDAGKLTTLLSFIENVNACKSEADQIPTNVIAGLGAGAATATLVLEGAFNDNAYLTMPAVLTGAITMDEVKQFVNHWNNAIKAQKNAEKLFGEL